MKPTDWARYPKTDPRGRGPATNRQLWRLNCEGLLALRKAPGPPIANRIAAHQIAELVEAEQRARFERERERSS